MRVYLSIVLSCLSMGFMAGLAAADSIWWLLGFIFCALCGAFWMEAELRTAPILEWHD